MNDLTLTVGIPTYNRSREIRNALDSIIDQLNADLRSRVEVLISDNASTDDTAAVVREYMNRYPDVVRYHRNERNLGFSRNVHNIFVQARGTFVIPLADDDAFEAAALPKILAVLDAHKNVGVVYLASTLYDQTLRRRLARPSNSPIPVAGQPVEGRHFPNGIDYFRKTGSLLNSMLSTHVIHRQSWLTEDLTPYYDGIVIHECAAAKILVNHAVFVIDKPLIKYRTSNAEGRWTFPGYPFNFHFDLLQFWKGSRELYPPDVHRAQYRENIRGILYNMLLTKADKTPIDRPLFVQRVYESCDKSFPSWLLLIALAFAPRFPFIIASRLLRRMVPT